MKLNEEQKRAIEHKDGPLLIIAGAGTGKTTVVTERIKHLILKRSVPATNILALTFTEKASREMEERVDIALPYGYTQLWISTFHAFCDRILQNDAIHIGLNPGYRLITEAESIALFRKYLYSFDIEYFRPLGNPHKFIMGMLSHFSRLKDEDITASQYTKWMKSTANNDEHTKWDELSRVYAQWEEIKIKEGVMEFGDLMSHTLALFRTRVSILNQYKQQFTHILVDEFQDTNVAQYELIKLLAPTAQNPHLAVVGDDSQSIYKFRGAAISNILSFQKDYPDATQVLLHRNYRSTQEILDRSHQLIAHNDPDTLESRLGISKKLTKMRKVEEHPIDLIYTDRVENEADQVAVEIESLLTSYRPKDIAILVRANTHADPFIRALRHAGIPYQFLGPGMLFRQAEVKDLIAYLKVLNSIDDAVSFYRLLTMSIWGISARDLASIIAFSKKYNLTLFESVELVSGIDSPSANLANGAQLPFIGSPTRSSLTGLMKMIYRHLELVPKESAGQILYYFLEDSGILKDLTNVETTVEEQRVQNISKFFNKLKSYEISHEDSSVPAVLDWIDLATELGESPLASDTDWTQNDAVNILTIHSAKGLEFPVVFLINLIAGRFPTYNRREQIPIPESLIKETLPKGDFHAQEERRLFYVGMTRAKDRLYFTSSQYYGEGKRQRKLSPFITEALGEKAVGRAVSVVGASQLSFLDYQKKDDPSSTPIIESRQPVTSLSYTQIEAFDLCPLKYYYRYVLKIPTPPAAAASFGQSVHEALRSFYELLKRPEPVTGNTLIDLLDKKWVPLGYTSKSHEQRTKKGGREMLKAFYKTAFDPTKIPMSLEQFFVVRITPSLKITGKIDRIDEVDDRLEIIDYKTGRVPTQREIDKSLQMTVYALAATDPGVLGKTAENVILSFYFLKEQQKISTTRTRQQLETARAELVEKAKTIERSSFEPRVGKYCDFCEFRSICPAWEE